MTFNLSRRDFNCIVSVHDLSSGGWTARVKDVAGSMNVRPPTAVGFLDKLTGEGLVEKGPSGYRLTKKGADCYNEATRIHRLLETLLARTGMSLEEACRIASLAGGDMDVAAVEKLCAHLSHPGSCPHGKPIPGGDMYDCLWEQGNGERSCRKIAQPSADQSRSPCQTWACAWGAGRFWRM